MSYAQLLSHTAILFAVAEQLIKKDANVDCFYIHLKMMDKARNDISRAYEVHNIRLEEVSVLKSKLDLTTRMVQTHAMKKYQQLENV